MTTQNKPIGCVKAATEIVGDKWTPQLLRFFINEDKIRFCRLQELTNGINPRTLSARLDNLEKEGIVQKKATTSTTRCEYCLTSKGRDLIPIIIDMEAWSLKYAKV